eukprot:gene24103-29248_t
MSAAEREVVCVLGATGNIGEHVVREIVERQSTAEDNRLLTIRAASRNSAVIMVQSTSRVQVQPVLVDLEDGASIAAAFEDVSKIFLVLPQVASPQKMAEYSKGDLGQAHVDAEAYIRSLQGLALTSIRPTSFNTNFLKYDLPSIKERSCFCSPLGTQAKVNWVDCRDIGAVAACCLLQPGHEGKTYDVTGPANSTLTAPSMASLLSEVIDHKVEYEELPVPLDGAYGGLWKFLRSGGFDVSTNAVEQ